MPPGDKPENELRNTIDVQLSLMKTDDIDSLKKVFDQFGRNIRAFESILGNMPNMSGNFSGGTPYSSGTASHQSTAPKSDVKPMTPEQQQKAADAATQRASGIQDWMLQSNMNKKLHAYVTKPDSHPLSNLIARGEIKNWRPRDIAGVGAYLLADKMYGGSGDPNAPANPHLMLPTMIAGGLALGGGDMAAKAAQGLVSGLRQQQAVTFGSNVGQSGDGLFGTRIGSSAFMDYYRSKLSSWEQVMGNPLSYSGKQAEEAQAIINGYGYRGKTVGQVANLMSSVSSAIPAISQEQQAAFVDPGIRFGSASVGDLKNELMQIPSAAKQAMMGVSAFTDQLLSVSAQLGEQNGVPQNVVAGQLMSMGAGNGFGPAVNAQIMGNPLYRNIAAAQNGGDFYKADYGPTAGATRQGILQRMIMRISGQSSWAGVQAMQKRGGPAWEHVKNVMDIVYHSPGGKTLLSNLNPQQLNNMIARGGHPAQIDLAQAAIGFGLKHSSMDHGTGHYSINSIMQNMGMSTAAQHQFLSSTAHEGYQARLKDLQKRLDASSDKKRDRAQVNGMTFGLTPAAAKLVKMIPKDNPATSNQNPPNGPSSTGGTTNRYGNYGSI